MNDNPLLEELELGHTTVLFGAKQGKYPQGNSVLVRGSERTAIIDPSLGVVARQNRLPAVDLMILSHCHEDHVAGAFLFPEAELHVHEADQPGMLSFQGMMDIFGYDGHPEIATYWEKAIREEYHYRERPDAQAFKDGDVFDLGGGVQIEVIHTPGHTRGHCALHILPDDVLFLGDIDLSSFGPYYGDAWSDLEDFERSLDRVRGVSALHYATFHHIGVVDRATFLERLDRYEAKIGDRETNLLEYLSEPRTLDEVATHRFVYRQGDDVAFAEPVERRSMGQHLKRLQRDGRVRELEPGSWQVI